MGSISSRAKDHEVKPMRGSLGIYPLEYAMMSDWDYTIGYKAGAWASVKLGKQRRWMLNGSVMTNYYTVQGLIGGSRINNRFISYKPGVFYQLNKSEKAQNNLGLNLFFETANPKDTTRQNIMGVATNYLLDVIGKHFVVRVNPSFGGTVYKFSEFDGIAVRNYTNVGFLINVAFGFGYRF